MKAKAILNRVVIKPDAVEEISKGGIVIPDKHKDKPRSGTVIFVGLGRVDNNGVRIPVDCKEGDTVFYAPAFAIPVKFADEDYIVLKDDDILLVVED